MTNRLKYYRFFLALGAILLVIALLNVVVDPFGVFQLTSISGFNKYKRNSYQHGVRALKSAQLVFNKYDLVILGSSRVEIGFSRQSPALAGIKAFNGGLPAADITEISAVMNFIKRHKNTKHIFIGLDFFAFSKNAGIPTDFPDSLFSGANPLSFYLKRALSWKALTASYNTVWNNYKGLTCAIFIDGFTKWPTKRRPFKRIMHTLRHYIKSPFLFGKYEYDPAMISQLEKVILECSEAGIKVDIGILPVHVLMLELIWKLDLWPTYVQWKVDLTKMAARLNTATRGSVPDYIWDFTSYKNKIIYDNIYDDSLKTPVKYFRDPAHCTPVVGDQILVKVLDLDANSDLLIANKLNSANISSFIRSEEASHYSLIDQPDSPAHILDSLWDTGNGGRR